MSDTYAADAHYWIVDGDETQLWSSAAPGYVNEDDATYLAWCAAGGQPTRIASEEELDAVLLDAGCGERSPNPPRRRVPKSVIISRITDEQLSLALSLMTERQKERWRAPDQPSVYADDPETVALVTACGADPEVVLAPSV